MEVGCPYKVQGLKQREWRGLGERKEKEDTYKQEHNMIPDVICLNGVISTIRGIQSTWKITILMGKSITFNS